MNAVLLFLGGISTFTLLVLAALYFLPTIVAWGKKKADGPIVINIFLGWTFIGWVVALAWAFNLDPKEKKKQEPPQETPWKRWN